MLRFVCDSPTAGGLTRREWLRVGGLGALGLAARRAAAHGQPRHGPGFGRALLACSLFLVAAAAIALRATNTRGEAAASSTDVEVGEPVLDAA